MDDLSELTFNVPASAQQNWRATNGNKSSCQKAPACAPSWTVNTSLRAWTEIQWSMVTGACHRRSSSTSSMASDVMPGRERGYLCRGRLNGGSLIICGTKLHAGANRVQKSRIAYKRVEKSLKELEPENDIGLPSQLTYVSLGLKQD